MNRRAAIFIFDLLILLGSFILMILIKPEPRYYLTDEYFIGLGILFAAWIIASFRLKKYIIIRETELKVIIKRILFSNFIATGVISIFVVALHVEEYSRLIFFGTVLIATLAELFFANLNYFLIHTVENATDLTNPPPKAIDIRKAKKAINYKNVHINGEGIEEAIISEAGEAAFDFITQFAEILNNRVLIISTNTRFNIQLQPDNYFKKIINLRRVNDIQYINKFFEAVNRKLPLKGIFISCVETKDLRKKRILNKYPPVIKWIIYPIDFFVKSVFPKFLLTKKIYFILTRGENRVLSRAEVLGRLYSCGFEVIHEQYINGLFYFVVKKVKEPAYDMNPTYGPFVKLKRIGKEGKIIKVYKFRTMHPYAEYLQDYIFKMHSLEEGGKFKNDFRISLAGKILRKFWIDELPMVVNLLKGDLKLVGIRPLSEQYFNLYNPELQEKRIKFKPGLIPPFYADLPKTLEEIQASELRYLELYEKHPVRTDFIYFWKAFYNILFKKARSS